ncbi:MAG: DUF167 domain-containing protein [Candidatus Hydrogenedens sp.]|nr:DUF167 domain-containing protein [Candidatus Hydrogenedens sp.]
MKNKKEMKAVTLNIRAYPRAARNRSALADNGDLQVYVTATPENNKANEAIISSLSKLLKTAKSNITIIVGLHSRDKVVKISGMTKKELRERLELIQ